MHQCYFSCYSILIPCLCRLKIISTCSSLWNKDYVLKFMLSQKYMCSIKTSIQLWCLFHWKRKEDKINILQGRHNKYHWREWGLHTCTMTWMFDENHSVYILPKTCFVRSYGWAFMERYLNDPRSIIRLFKWKKLSECTEHNILLLWKHTCLATDYSL